MKRNSVQLREFADRYTVAWCSQRPAQVAACFAPGGSLTVNAGAPAVGRAAITELVRSFMHAFPDLHLKMDKLEIEGERITYHWTLGGTHTGPGGTGHGIQISGCEVWKFDSEGLIAQSQGQFDEAVYRRQLDHGLDGA